MPKSVGKKKKKKGKIVLPLGGKALNLYSTAYHPKHCSKDATPYLPPYSTPINRIPLSQ
jgi:hypothetical protein